ncbi:hypothetical protein [Burkholderia cenocepacia]|uniref:hypothetical protein n=1 Tax=Burkholderia cenocepacia TaxID=95486 RepID=UPI003D663813
MSVADQRGGHYLRNLADTSARHLYTLDGHQPIGSTAPRDPDSARSGTDDMPATLGLLLHPPTSTEADPSGYRMMLNIGYDTLYIDLCHTAPRIGDTMDAPRFVAPFRTASD